MGLLGTKTNKWDKVSIIRKGTVFSGILETDDLIRIEGDVHGDIITSKKVFVGASGIIDGNITAGEVVINGNVTGDVYAKDYCTLASGGHLVGDICAKRINLLKNSNFDGICKIRPDGISEQDYNDMLAKNNSSISLTQETPPLLETSKNKGLSKNNSASSKSERYSSSFLNSKMRNIKSSEK